ncbi:carbamoyltransferase C-terminal domain-containing protein [Parachitinimonas caeni]|uniref:Carbamoyltransferase C-terminal domain-containing protein n=1 Tax=Parachitinimonas caeni TaxID=3031301 RepID=A0ABT7E3D2_9NEIS|nr:carbamoyltransferase C-terminal domain-containing protein [Parachitinimonas caeni]MDK2126808.1 carbamoyltransferase C-terminal domain-containing protein [Parachitinimonas caeni]
MKPSAVLGINRTQDGSVCFIDAQGQLWAVQKERLSRVKHHWGKLGDVALYAQHLPQIGAAADVVVECYSSDTEMARIDDYHAELRALVLKQGGSIHQISHHLAHLYSAYFPSGFAASAVMVLDFQGSPARCFTEDYPLPAGWDGDSLEVASFYHCEGGSIRCIAKQLWNGDRRRMVGLGAFYQSLTQMIFPKFEGQEGKVMGLAPLGDATTLDLPPLEVRGHEVFIPDAWHALFRQPGDYFYQADDAERFQRAANLAAIGQKVYEDALLQLADWLHAQTGQTALCLAGGCGLNCSANGKLVAQSPFTEVYIPPAPGDGGTAIGCALYGQIEILGQSSQFRWTENDYLGPEPLIPATLDDHDLTGLIVEQPADLPATVAHLLDGQCAVALFEGRSEMGPRALGHRSILADPRHDAMRVWINRAVKGREVYRPLAPVVLEELAGDYFQVRRPMRFMQYAVQTLPHARTAIPAVVHVDGSARVQMVPAHPVSTYRQIIECFFARTGVPVLLDTSFNGQEEPIVETIADALAAFRKMPLQALALPPFLIHKQARPATWQEESNQES